MAIIAYLDDNGKPLAENEAAAPTPTDTKDTTAAATGTATVSEAARECGCGSRIERHVDNVCAVQARTARLQHLTWLMLFIAAILLVLLFIRNLFK